MSWAADRQTTRVEDEAYCLLGLFGINMPLIYGEGRKAFVRLQEELLWISDDASLFVCVSVKPSESPGPTELRISHQDGHIVVSERFDSDVNTIADEEQIVGMVGLYSTSPTYFRKADKYIPYPLKGLGLRVPIPTTIDGHLVRLQVTQWKVPVKELHELQSDSAIQSGIFETHGVRLTKSSVRKLSKCARAVSMSEWRIAFLNSRRRDGGIVGILLQEDSTRIIYNRQHFPSIIETESHTSFRGNHDIDAVGPIYIEGDSLRIDRTKCRGPGHAARLEPASIGNFYNQMVLRALNLQSYGFSDAVSGAGSLLQQTVFWNSSDIGIPLMAFTAQLGYQKTSTIFSHGDEQGVVCKLYWNRRLQYMRHSELSRMEPLSSKFIPSYRGLSTSMPLNDELRLVFRTQMQWKRKDTVIHGDRMKKQCLLSVSIVRTAEAIEEGVMLEDPATRDELLNALSRHFTRSPGFATSL